MVGKLSWNWNGRSAQDVALETKDKSIKVVGMLKFYRYQLVPHVTIKNPIKIVFYKVQNQ